MKKIIKNLPVPAAGLMLGLAAAGNLVASYGNIFKSMFGIVSALLLLLLLIKATFTTRAVMEDLKNPAIAGIAGTFPMGIMILSAYIQPFSPIIGYGMWMVGTVLQCVLIIYFTKKFIFNFDLQKVFPSYFVVYVGIAAASVAAPVFSATGTGKGLFWFGFIAYLILLPIITYRVLVIKSIPEPLLPTITIFAAPASLGLVGYLKLFQEVNMTIFWLLTFLSLIMLFAVLLYMPKMIRLKFYPSYSAFTFPLVISAIAIKDIDSFLTKMHIGVPGFGYLVHFEELLAVVFVIYVLIRYIGFMFLQHVKVGSPNVQSVSK